MTLITVSIDAVGKRFPVTNSPLAALFSTGPTKSVLEDISVAVRGGETLAVIGPNGSGKTTLLKLVAGMLLPDTGRITVSGGDIGNGEKTRNLVSYAMANERSFYPRLTAQENLAYFAALENVPPSLRANRIEEALRFVELAADADIEVMKFSSGMHQRLGIARAILKRPAVLLLDEPTRSTDAESTQNIWKLISACAGQGAAVFIATHDFEEVAAVASRIIVLRDGRLAGTSAVRGMSPDQIRSWYEQICGAESSVSAVVGRDR